MYFFDLIFFHSNDLGPTPVTVSDFIQMVWDHRSPVIVMLTRLVEKGKVYRADVSMQTHIHNATSDA